MTTLPRLVALPLALLLAGSGCTAAPEEPGTASAGPAEAGAAGSTASAPASTTSTSAPTADPTETADPTQPSAAAAPVVVTFAGDIADGTAGTTAFAAARATGDLVRRIAPRWALVGGDNAYSSGTLNEYRTKYDPTWGSFKGITKPVPGNHEYESEGAAGYSQYFFAGASRPYYAFSLGNRWRAYMLNCEISCGAGSAQEQWLRKDLAAQRTAHVLAVVHRPRYSSGEHGGSTRLTAVWNALLGAKADLVLSGHDHTYEVFAKQDANGRARPTDGITQFVNGTGGAELYKFREPRPNSLKRLNSDFGVLKLSLGTGSYSWQFLASGYCWSGGDRVACPSRNGQVLDSGSRATNRP